MKKLILLEKSLWLVLVIQLLKSVKQKLSFLEGLLVILENMLLLEILILLIYCNSSGPS
jgi:hypothetical protein